MGYLTICFSNENKIDVPEHTSLFGMVYLGGFTILPYSGCLLFIAFHSHNKHKNMEDVIIPRFYSQLPIGDKSLIPTKPCCLFIVPQYVS